MNYPLIWDNLAAYSMQIGLLVGLAAFVPTVLRLRLPGGRLAYWHMLLGACLLLPAVRPWKQAVITLTSYVPPSAPSPVVSHVAPVTAVDWTEIAMLVLMGGMVIRTIWLASGMWRLSRLRKHSTPLTPKSS